LGFDLWQVKSGTVFDNVLITDSMDEAKEARDEILKGADAEKKMKEAQDEEEKKATEAETKKEDEADDDEDDDDEEKKEEHDEL